jgi:RimJ/RimL family protein N-acetyltransferase
VKRRLRKMLKGKKVVLRTTQKDDVEHWVRWFNDIEVQKYLSHYVLYGVTREDEEECYNSLRKSPNNKTYTITTLEGKVIGMIGLRSITWEWRNAEVVIIIGEKDEWGKGYGTDAMRVLVKFAFERMNLHRIYLHVSGLNQGGVKCYENVGFKKEGVLRESRFLDGKYHDTVVMGILRGELK